MRGEKRIDRRGPPLLKSALAAGLLATGLNLFATSAGLAASNEPLTGALEAGLISAGLIEPTGYLSDPAVALAATNSPLTRLTTPRASQPPLHQALTLTVARGDTLMDLLVSAGIDRSEAHEAITALRAVFRPRDLKVGQEVHLRLAGLGDAVDGATDGNSSTEVTADGRDEAGRLLGLSLRPSVEQEVAVTRSADNAFQAKAVERPLGRRFAAVSGRIESSLAAAAQQAGLPPKVLIQGIRAFSYDVDFQRDLQVGDRFEFFYETFHDSDGELAKTGKLFFGRMTLSGSEIALYRHDLEDGDWDYFNPNGQSVRRALLRTPVDGARISSGYGKRRHPVLGYNKMHRGVDFAAPKGTPIYAAGKGVIDFAGRNGAYGKYVRIRHDSTYKTAYAHLSRYGKGIKGGVRVKQGQIIGYVGSTGRSTGPHLHYEILKNGKQTNPRKVKMPSGIKLTGAALERFGIAREEIDRLRDENRRAPQQVAQGQSGDRRARRKAER